MGWVKKGLFFVPDGSLPWACTHAQVPTVDVVSESVWRIYYAARDKKNRCSISYIDVESGNPHSLLYMNDQPILSMGKLGTFDDSGLMPSWIVTHEGVKYLYYTGWNVRQTVPYQNAIGLALSQDDGQTFERYGEGPILSLTVHEPYFIGTATVLIEDGIWRNWYASCTQWEIVDGRAEPFYHLKYAESRNGIDWERHGIVAIDYKDGNEAGIVRSSVLKENVNYKMWYAYRQVQDYRVDRIKSYRIGYAESENGIVWHRMDDQVGIDISEFGWDSDMIAYPCVISVKGIKYMFYNGNGFGKTGIGYAVWEGVTGNEQKLSSLM